MTSGPAMVMLTEVIRIDAVSGDDGVCRLERPVHHDDRQSRFADPGRRLCRSRLHGRHERRRDALACRCGCGRPCDCISCSRVAGSAGATPSSRRLRCCGSGLAHLADYLVYASLFGGALTLLIIQFRTMPLPRLLVGREWAERLHRVDAGVPYGIALAAAALLVYPHTEWMAADQPLTRRLSRYGTSDGNGTGRKKPG